MTDKYEPLRKAAENATPGPWKPTSAPGGWDAVADDLGATICNLVLNHPQNSAFIAAANPQAILELLAERDALRSALTAITDQLERVGDTRMHKDGQFIADARAALETS